MNVEIFRRTVLLVCVLGAQSVIASEGLIQGPTADPVEAEIRLLLRNASYAEAEARARTLLATRDTPKSDGLAVARALDLLVQALVEGGKPQHPDALPGAMRAVDLKERVMGPQDPSVALSLSNLGLVLRRQGKLDEARIAYERSLRIREASLGAEHADVARSLAALSALAAAAGDFTRAREFGERALNIAEHQTPPDHLLEAGAANNLAQALFQMNDFAGSKQRLEQTIRAYEAALGADHPEVGKALSNLATVVSETGDLSGARTLYERATAIQEKRQGPDHPDVALNVNNLADIFFLIGDYTQAATHFERALQTLERALGPEHTRVAMVLGNLAQVRVAEGEYEAARPLYARALEIREKALGPEHPSLVYTLTGYGELHARVRGYAQARALYERALAIAERAFGAEHPMTAYALHGLGDLLLAAGDVAAAEPRLERALRIRTALLGDDHPLVAESRASLAQIFARTSRTAEAMNAALEAERVARQHLQVTAQALDERQALGYAERRVSGGDIALSLLAASAAPDALATERTWDTVVRSRALVLEEMASRRRVIATVSDPTIARLAGELVGARQRLAGLLVRSAGDPASRDRIEQAARERNDAERALAERSLEFRSDRARTQTGLADALRALPQGAALVAYARYRRSDLVTQYLAFVARGDGTSPVSVPLGNADAIDRAIERWRSSIVSETQAGRPTLRAERLHRDVGQELRRLIWDPLRAAVAGSKQLFIVPAGPLHLVNWGALPGADGRYLVEDAALLHYLSTERDLVRERAPLGQGLLVVDDPSYDATGKPRSPRARSRNATTATAPMPCVDVPELRFDPLPESRIEGGQIAALWSSAFKRPDANSTSNQVLRLSGTQATEAALRENIAGKRVIHLATHGFFLGGWCPPGTTPNKEAHPLLVAGLALTGANASARRPSNDDGVLLAEEIASLDLRGVEWAVLSACDTGAGVLRAGDELFGLRRVFQIAGVHTILVSLWPVDDAMTRQWMTAVYRRRFADDLPTAAAVRAATVEAIRTRRGSGLSTHPAYWGSFIAAGQW
jgi:CHAT domain-containing protein/Tfp pilus assembly protein PilF